MIFGKTKKRLDKIEETQRLIVDVLNDMRTINKSQLGAIRGVSKHAFFAAKISHAVSFVIQRILEDKPLDESEKTYLLERIKNVLSEFDENLDEGDIEVEVDGRDN